MKQKYKDYFTAKVQSIIDSRTSKKSNLIFVLLGISDLLDFRLVQKYIVDIDTFLLNGDDSIFTKDWFIKTFTNLSQQKDYHVLSYAQFCYLNNYIEASFFKDRIVIIRDNMRQLYLLNTNDFVEKTQEITTEERPTNLPIYQAEQLALNNKCYFSIKSPLEDYDIVNLFTEKKILKDLQKQQDYQIIDANSDSYALDVFINDCISEDDFAKKVLVKFYEKQPFNTIIENKLKLLNAILDNFRGQLYLLQEVAIQSKYNVSKKTVNILKKYWGPSATFRQLKVYQNPNFNKEIIEISQGLIVDTIISEYEKSKKNEPVRDLFLTAPTGAGKSLLFQLPAFYVSKKGDVTIIVSPLIALMKDQVKAIISDRKYDKVSYINSELSLIDRDRVIENCKNGSIDILYMSPELLLSYDISFFIGNRTLGLLVIDEAHLITTWGRDFRVDYWFLGSYIRKIRKYRDCNFPMVAVTATAIYGGANDMVFDSIDSLFMQNPYIFIGQVKRNDIEFVVNNYEKFSKQYEKNKINQTIEFIEKINELNLKTIVYAPYTKHIKQILDGLKVKKLNIAEGYYGTLDSMLREFAYRKFKSGQSKIMVCTKAFGMGVDISDIQVVYHHAPSGLLPDYVQEIGRVARNPEIKGYATLNYSPNDQKYSKTLHGMSALRQYQLREVIKKIHRTFLKNNKSRNLLLSVEDFGYIFQDAFDLDQKVLTALMMIEKDYLAKHRFNVLIARPRKLFAKVYARVIDEGLKRMKIYYKNTFHVISNTDNGYSIVEMDLDKIWYEHFREKSFPMMKKEFYQGNLFKNNGVELFPQLKISFERFDSFSNIYQQLHSFFNNIQNVFANMSGFFDQDSFNEKIYAFIKNKRKSEKISKFILSSYSGQLLQPGIIEDNAYLQMRRTSAGIQYRVYNTLYLKNFASLLRRFSNLFENNDNLIVNRYVTNKEINAVNYVRLGYFIEMLDFGTFEIKGGENPMVFVRINDPYRIERDSENPHYKNALLQKILERFSISSQIFDHFFLRSFSNEDRWNFIEDFFLGEEVDDLLANYAGSEGNKVDIIEYLKKNATNTDINKTSFNDSNLNVNVFYAKVGIYYKLNNLLTIDTETGTKTMKVTEWLVNDIISFDKERRRLNLKIDKEVFAILVAKLRNNHKEYFKDVLGLKMKIVFKGYDKSVEASVPYNNNPIDFYKWWCKNKDKVTLSKKEQIELFDKVFIKNPKLLLDEHKKILGK